MTSLFKNQILKHLSRFVLNLSPNQISLSALKGEGELTELELNCPVLAELLELPTWLRLTEATCNRAAIRIQWTKLKTVPIQLSLDEIRVRVETCEELRAGSSSGGFALSPPASGQYGFKEKVLDGIMLSVNLVHVTLTSLAFTASFQMSRIVVESQTPSWQRASLPMTRLKDMDRGEVLIFKELSWQTVRIEACSTVSEDLTPLRLITNQARCRITIKKRMSDCAILGCRLVLILDDLLWVLTDDQLKAALHFVDSVSGLIKKATEQTQKAKAARKLQNQHVNERVTVTRGKVPSGNPALARAFKSFDVVETSYHFYSDRIDLHFCDDPGGGRSSHPDLQQGGAFQVSMARLQVDYYPYHLARGDRRHWVRYNDSQHRQWLQSRVACFDGKLLDTMLAGKNHTPLSRAGVGRPQAPKSDLPFEDTVRDNVVSQLARMMTSNVVVRLSDLTLWRVATASPSASPGQPQELMRGDAARFGVPSSQHLLHMEFTQFYYPGDQDFPLPPPAIMLYLNPITVWMDLLTIVWINAFTLNLQKSVQQLQASLALEQSDALYADIKVEMLLPCVICPGLQDSSASEMRPKSLHLQASKISAANYRSQDTGSRADLAAVLERFQQTSLFFGAEFPSQPGDASAVPEKLVNHAVGKDDVKPGKDQAQSGKELMWTEARDVWQLSIESVCAEFHGSSLSQAPVPLLDSTHLSLWLYQQPRKLLASEGRSNRKLLREFYGGGDGGTADIHVVATTSQLVSLQLDHHQLLFLLRLAETLSEMSAFLAADTAAILPPDPNQTSLVVAGHLPQADLHLLFPSSGLGDTSPPLSDTCSLQPPASPDELCPSPALAQPAPVLVPVGDKMDPLSAQGNAEAEASSQFSSIYSGRADVAEQNLPPQSVKTSSSSSPVGHAVHNNYTAVEPPVKVNLIHAPSSGDLRPRSLTSSFNNVLDGLGLHSSSQPSIVTGTRSPELDIDTLSIRSDDSGESEGFILLGGEADKDGMEALFSVRNDDRAASPAAEMAEEVTETVSALLPGSQTELQGPESESCGGQLVTGLLLRLGSLAIQEVSKPGTGAILLTASNLGIAETPAQEWRHFQERFRQSGKTWSSSLLSCSSNPVLKLRMDSRPPTNPAKALSELPSSLNLSLREKISRATEGSLRLCISDLPVQLASSTLLSLQDWAQDEVIPSPVPLHITLQNITLRLEEDRPPLAGCPAPPPLEMAVPGLVVKRDKYGLFSVENSGAPGATADVPPPPPGPADQNKIAADLEAKLTAALTEVRVLRARLARQEEAAAAKSSEVCDRDKRLETASSQIANLVEEKKSLMDTIKYLQEELLKSGKKPVS